MERMSKIQLLYDACNVIFSKKKGPTFQDIQWLRNLLSTVEANDVGIDEFSCQRLKDKVGVCHMTYIHIFECEEFSIGVFCFPAGMKFPLHDHPGMTVLSKVLYGSVHVKAYDWVECGTSKGKTVGLAGAVVDGIVQAPCEASVLFPTSGGNIHSLTALTPAAILDVLSPPYSAELGRPSTYYSEVPFLPGYAILEEREQPDDLVVYAAPYVGPQLSTEDDFY
ncbi:hypothetical protein AAC387_Pa11g1340 [Persea americana]